MAAGVPARWLRGAQASKFDNDSGAIGDDQRGAPRCHPL